MSQDTIPQYFQQRINDAREKQLSELDLSYDWDIDEKLTKIPACIFELTHLKKLNLRDNDIKEIPSEIARLANLEYLDLIGNEKLTSFSDELIERTPHISLRLTWKVNPIIPEWFSQIKQLGLEIIDKNESIFNARRSITTIPDGILNLENLVLLKIWLRYSNNWIVWLKHIKELELDLSSNQLKTLPESVGNLVNLTQLDLSRNKLNTLPESVTKLTNLTQLNLSRNKLETLPESVTKLKTNLTGLYLSFNQLETLPKSVTKLTNLTQLDLSFNQLKTLPESVTKLTNLTQLGLNSNQLENLPESVTKLSDLTGLYLSFNQLETLPESVTNLSNLTRLYLISNQLETLPESVGNLKNLTQLDLKNNRLSNLPTDIKKLNKLQKLDLRGNPVPIPPEILGAKDYLGQLGDVQEILDFYFQVQEKNETEPLYEAKFLIIGAGGAGKTSLAKKIEDKNYKLKSDEDSTQGIDVIQWKFSLPNDKEFCVNIWDFGGQEIYHQTHQFFLTKRSLYALVADSRTEDTNFYWWLKVAELLSDQSPILIIKNEKQDRQCEVNERQLRGEFPNLKEVLATNLATNRGLEEIKKAIKLHITNLPHVGEASPLPKVWVRVRAALENYARNYITVEEYCQLCRVNNLTDRKDMLRLSSYLHDLGVCLHFQDDSTLKHYVILKPSWGTTAVYKVLDNKTVRDNLGCFSISELQDIWGDREYEEMLYELLQLMMRFKLCYPIPNKPSQYIAPQLLEIEEPNYTWEKSHNLILSYKYEFMPKGMLTRFIVETHPWIEQQKLVWRNGVVLNKNNTRAEVIENYNQREIKVRVVGSRKKELMAVVTHELDKIHRSFERLEYHTLVPCNCEKCFGSENPYSYPLEELYDFLKDGDYEIQCRKSRKMTDVRTLIDDVNLPAYEEERRFEVRDNPLQAKLEEEKEESFSTQKNTSKHKYSMNYQDFQISVDRNDNIRASSQEQGEESDKFQLNIKRIRLTLNLINRQQTDKELLKALGGELYDALFPNTINALFHKTIGGAQANGDSVRLRLIFESPKLASIPWEFLYDDKNNTFLGNNTQTVLSRYINVPQQKRDIKSASLPLKVLVVISSPSDLISLDTAGEEKLIREALTKNIEEGQIELDILHKATIRNINQKLREKPYNVFHFIGHGIFEDNKGYIDLVDEDGKARKIDDETFANFFLGNNNLGLVILNSCQGATVSSNEAFKGTAPNLVQKGIPAVIAMQYSIWDATAKKFADEFYRTLALGYPVDAAIQTTRNAISMEVGLDRRDFATPVLYMRAKDGIILQGF